MNDIVVVGCGVGWGLVVASPLIARTRRVQVVERWSPRPSRPGFRWPRARGPVGRVIGGIAAKRRTRRDAAALLAELPSVIDLLIVAVGAGSTPRGALELATRWGPERASVRLREVTFVTELGGSFVDALRELGRSTPLLAPIVDALVASAHLGAPAGSALARVGDDTRQTLRRQAEARARTVPIKLLFPLVFLVLPAFGLLTVVPAVLSALSRL